MLLPSVPAQQHSIVPCLKVGRAGLSLEAWLSPLGAQPVPKTIFGRSIPKHKAQFAGISVHRKNVELTNAESKKTSNDKTSNGTQCRMTKCRMVKNVERTKCRMGQNAEWT